MEKELNSKESDCLTTIRIQTTCSSKTTVAVTVNAKADLLDILTLILTLCKNFNKSAAKWGNKQPKVET